MGFESVGESYCNGDCSWVNNECINTEDITTTITTTNTGCEWTEAKNACIKDHNNKKVENVESITDCIDLCKEEQTFICLSVDYFKKQEWCQLSSVTSITAQSSYVEPCSVPNVMFANCIPLTGKRVVKYEVIKTRILEKPVAVQNLKLNFVVVVVGGVGGDGIDKLN